MWLLDKLSNMIIEYINGPNKGQTEVVISQEEEKGSPIYITDSGKELSINDLNKVYRIKKDPTLGSVSLKELGDPSLAEIESEFIDSKVSGKNKEVEPSSEVITKPTSKPEEPIAKSFSLLKQLLSTAKRKSTKLNIELNLNLPTIEFYNLVNNAIEVSDDEFAENLLNDINADDLKNMIKTAILSKYKQPNKPVKEQTKTKKDNTGDQLGTRFI